MNEQPQPSLEERVSVLIKGLQPYQRMALHMVVLEEQAILACKVSKEYSLSEWRTQGSSEERVRFNSSVDHLILKN